MLIAVADTETSGTDVINDRIIQAFVGVYDTKAGDWACKSEWLIDPGIEIPTGASDVHGYTTERIREVGNPDAAGAIQEIMDTLFLWGNMATGRALAIYNASYDLSILWYEAERYGVEWKLDGIRPVDAYILDKAIDPYRKGSRKLVNVAEHYGVPVEENAHDAGADCLMTARVTEKLLKKWTRTPDDLVTYQKEQALKQRTSLEEYFRRTDPKAVVDKGWPFHSSIKKEEL